MQKWIVALLLAAGTIGVEVQAQAYLQGRQAHERIPGTIELRFQASTALPTFVKFQLGQQPEAIGIHQFLQNHLGMSDEHSLVLLSDEKDALGGQHYRFRQHYLGVAIAQSSWIIHVKDGVITSANGQLFEVASAGKAELSESAALDKALEYVGAKRYMWASTPAEKQQKHHEDDVHAIDYPQGELVQFPVQQEGKAHQLKAAYLFDIYAREPLSRQELYVDAQTGEILRSINNIHVIDAHGTAETAYSGTQDIVADSLDVDSFRLHDYSRGNGVITLNANTNFDFNNLTDFYDDDNHWDNANPALDQYAGDAHWGAEVTYDYFLNTFNRNSMDDNGFELRSIIHYGSNFVNAFFDGQNMVYGDAGGGFTPLVSVDIVAHEAAHGLTRFTADLVYQDQSGALNESFSDIFGTCIEAYAKPNAFNWEIGEQIGQALRSMSNPKQYGDPDTYLGINWFTGTQDNGGVHINSGVQNKWFYLLTEGGTGTNDNGDTYSVNGIGLDAAARIAYRNLTVYLTEDSEYNDARFFAIQAALDLFGPCSSEVEATVNAWYAVGVGEPYVDGVSSDFDGGLVKSCTAPLEVEFLNLSSNATQFTWNFGDGTVTTSQLPTHTYQNYGTYTVSLTADGSTCGTDTKTLVDYVVVDSLDTCVVYMNLGPSPMQDRCIGQVYDIGGPNGTQPGSFFSQITIDPPGADSIRIRFPYFNIEDGQGNCAVDYIEVFDGINAGAPLVGRYCNTTGNPGTLVLTSGAAFMRQVSSTDTEDADFKMEWACLPAAWATWVEEEAINSPGVTIYPNPARESFTVSFDFESNEDFSLELLDLNGRLVETLHNGPSQGSAFQKAYSTDGLPSGVYFVRYTSNQHTVIQKLIAGN